MAWTEGVKKNKYKNANVTKPNNLHVDSHHFSSVLMNKHTMV